MGFYAGLWVATLAGAYAPVTRGAHGKGHVRGWIGAEGTSPNQDGDTNRGAEQGSDKPFFLTW